MRHSTNTYLLNLISLICLFAAATACSNDNNGLTEWPNSSVYAKPGSRWWWMGSAVDSTDLKQLIKQYADAGIGTLEISPIYGVQGNEANDIPFLSDKWMQMYNYATSEAQKNGMLIDLNTGSGWPFGGPEVPLNDAAGRMLVEVYHLNGNQTLSDSVVAVTWHGQREAQLLKLMAYNDNTPDVVDLTNKVDSTRILHWTAPRGSWTLYAVFNGHTYQWVKRAQADGLVIDHFSKDAVSHYLNTFSSAFAQTNTPAPNNFFNDSYEVYNADITPHFFDEFYSRRGYRLENHLPLLFSKEVSDSVARLKSDYCETISDLLHDNFTSTWTAWAHSLNSTTRNQAHGSPANLIDIYAAVDIPECEGFGISDFGIKGLRKDSLTHINHSDLSMLKYASSAAHISGKKYVSSESFTWLTEHFRTSLSQCKPEIDLFFVSGVNRIYLHGITYSPVNDPWPGWQFYATADMGPTNPMWTDAKNMFQYIERSQSFLQMGTPDNDFLVYLPIYDIWYNQNKTLLPMDIHRMSLRAPDFAKVINLINEAGYDVDYTSDNFILNASVSHDGNIIMQGGAEYKALVIPNAKFMPANVMKHIISLAELGATIIFADKYPQNVPGLSNVKANKKQLVEALTQLPPDDFTETATSKLGFGRIITGTNYSKLLEAANVVPERMKTIHRIQFVRRKNNEGYHYFISNLTPYDVDDNIKLAVNAKSAMFFDPLTGQKGKVSSIDNSDDVTHIRLQLASGESIILRTFNSIDVDAEAWQYKPHNIKRTAINGQWKLHFSESTPAIADTFHINNLCLWTDIDDPRLKTNMGTAVYSTIVNIDDVDNTQWGIDLGDVRETARIKINGQYLTTLWSVPFRCNIDRLLKKGNNLIEIEVTGLPANRISQMDREHIPWRKFKNVNMTNIDYNSNDYSLWKTVDCGLRGPVTLLKYDLSNDK